MDTTDLIISIIQGIEYEGDIPSYHTCDCEEYLVKISWDNTDVSIDEVRRNGCICHLPSHINKQLLIDVAKEKVNEVRINKIAEERAQESARLQRDHEKSINWFGSMAGY